MAYQALAGAPCNPHFAGYGVPSVRRRSL